MTGIFKFGRADKPHPLTPSLPNGIFMSIDNAGGTEIRVDSNSSRVSGYVYMWA